MTFCLIHNELTIALGPICRELESLVTDTHEGANLVGALAVYTGTRSGQAFINIW